MVAAALATFVDGNATAELTQKATGTITVTDNVFRLPDATAAGAGDKRGDVTVDIGLGGALRSEQGDWTFAGDAEIDRLAFARNSRLDTISYRVGGSAERRDAIGDGRLAVQWARRLTPFSDIRTFAANRQQALVATGDMSRAILGDVRLVGTVAYLRSLNSAAQLRGNDVSRVTAGGGLGYFSPSGNILALQGDLSDTAGLNATQIAIGGRPGAYRSSSRESHVYARLHFEPSALLQFDGELGYARHDDRSIFDGDFSGAVWSAVSTWSPRRAVRIRAAVKRAFEAEDGLYTNGLVVRSADVSVDADATERLTLRGTFGLRDRNFRFDPLAQAAPRDDRYKRVSLTAASDIGRIARLEVSVAHERRTATLADQRYASFDLMTTLVLRRSR